MKVTPDLVDALRCLRYKDRSRHLWIDQVCVDQKNTYEKNYQVALMADIYGRASTVCIWLGVSDNHSSMALDFIKSKVLQLQNFDELCEDKRNTKNWNALLVLMQRPWFSRRWVVQEVALAHNPVLYCGRDEIPWKEFAVAVELFVEVETATHRLSEVMKKDQQFHHVPRWFEYVSVLGASLLVEATGKVFRSYEPGGLAEHPHASDDEEASESGRWESDSAIASLSEGKRSRGRPLLTLEYLVSTLSIFEVTNQHDAVYALLAIARDIVPEANDRESNDQSLVNTQEVLEHFTQKKRYKVDYEKPFSDVCQTFVAFCIQESKDSTRALDIICRPWAPAARRSVINKMDGKRKPSRSPARKNPQPTPDISVKPAGSETSNGHLAVDPARLHSSASQPSAQSPRAEGISDPPSPPLPTWVSSLSGAAHVMLPQAGSHELKMNRKNADPLVGQPPSNQALERNYNAAETKGVDRKSLRFKRRSDTGQWSLHVKGFKLDYVAETKDASQSGGIPTDWADTGGWSEPYNEDPPNHFWRTLVADRGHNGKNPPVYYSRACKESFDKGGYASGSVNLSELIANERCSVIAQFCRRVQAVIWNRCLITTEAKRLGLSGKTVKAGDLICILYGCSVPVALRRQRKTKEDVIKACDDDLNSLKERIRTRFESAQRQRKAKQETQRRFRRWEQQMRRQFRDNPGGNPTDKSQGTSPNPKESIPIDGCQKVGETLQQGSPEKGDQNIITPIQENPNVTATEENPTDEPRGTSPNPKEIVPGDSCQQVGESFQQGSPVEGHQDIFTPAQEYPNDTAKTTITDQKKLEGVHRPEGNPTDESRGPSPELVPGDSYQQVGESFQQGSSVEDEQGEQNILPPAQGNPNATAEDPMTLREKSDGVTNLAMRGQFAAWLKERKSKAQLTEKEIEIWEKLID